MSGGLFDDGESALIDADFALFSKLKSAHEACKNRAQDSIRVITTPTEPEAAKRKSYKNLPAPEHTLFYHLQDDKTIMRERIIKYGQDIRTHYAQHVSLCDIFKRIEQHAVNNKREEVWYAVTQLHDRLLEHGEFLQGHSQRALMDEFLYFPSHIAKQMINGTPSFNTTGMHTGFSKECSAIASTLVDFACGNTPLKACRIYNDSSPPYAKLLEETRTALGARLEFDVEG
jgi:hypothetical protein